MANDHNCWRWPPGFASMIWSVLDMRPRPEPLSDYSSCRSWFVESRIYMSFYFALWRSLPCIALSKCCLGHGRYLTLLTYADTEVPGHIAQSTSPWVVVVFESVCRYSPTRGSSVEYWQARSWLTLVLEVVVGNIQCYLDKVICNERRRRTLVSYSAYTYCFCSRGGQYHQNDQIHTWIVEAESNLLLHIPS